MVGAAMETFARSTHEMKLPDASIAKTSQRIVVGYLSIMTAVHGKTQLTVG
jgi:hypothetical protein